MKKSLVITTLLLCCLTLLPAGQVLSAQEKEPEYVLSLNLSIPPIHNRWNFAMKQWCEEIYRRSNGRLKIEPYFAESLSKENDSFESVKYGLADMTEFSYDVAVGHFPFHERAFTTVSMGYSMDNPTDWLVDIQNSFPEIMKELSGVRVLFSHAQSIGMVIGSKEPITTLEQLANKKINVIGDYQVANKLRALGVSVVSVPMGEVYMSMQQGIIDAASCDFDLLISRRLSDVIKHVTLINTTCFVFCVAINEKSYERLPDDLRDVIDSVSNEYGRLLFNNFWNNIPYNALKKFITEMDGKIHILTPEEYMIMDRASEMVWKEWTQIVDDAGYPGKKMIQRIQELGKKYSTPWSESRVMKIARELGAAQ